MPDTHTKDRQLRLTLRDVAVLADLGDYRFLTAPQLAVLHFPSPRSAQDRMRALVEHGLAHRVFLPVRPYDRTAETVYALAGRGAKLVAERRGGEQPRYLTERERRSGLFLDHTLRRNDVRLCFELLARRAVVQTGPWYQKPEVVGSAATVLVTARRKERVPMVPDGFLAVVKDGRYDAFVVEVDMGTVRVERMRLRYRAYWKWWKTGAYRATWGAAPLRVLTLTTDERRLEALRKVASDAPERGRRGSQLFWFTTLDQAHIEEPERLLGSVWTVRTSGRLL